MIGSKFFRSTQTISNLCQKSSKYLGLGHEKNIQIKGIHTADIALNDKIIALDTYVSPLKTRLLNSQFPGKDIVDISLAEILYAASSIDIQQYLRNLGLQFNDLNEEQLYKINSIIQDKKQFFTKSKDMISDAVNIARPKAMSNDALENSNYFIFNITDTENETSDK